MLFLQPLCNKYVPPKTASTFATATSTTTAKKRLHLEHKSDKMVTSFIKGGKYPFFQLSRFQKRRNQGTYQRTFQEFFLRERVGNGRKGITCQREQTHFFHE